MEEKQRIKGLFRDLYDGNPWIDINITGTLQTVTAQQAAKKTAPWNSIWEITNHLISWRITVLERINGNVQPTPEHNFFVPVQDTSPEAWKKTLVKFADTQQQWITFLETLDDSSLEKTNPGNPHNWYELAHGIIQHDAYHLGQVVMLSKLGA